MNRYQLLTLLLLIGMCTAASGQLKRTSVPLGDAVGAAIDISNITADGARPFHLRVSITEPENPDSPYHGTIEEWWISTTQWRREISNKEGMRQTIVVTGGQKTERDEGDYFPLWLRNFVSAIFAPIPNPVSWKQDGANIDQITMPNGAQSYPTVRAQSKIGTGDRATDAFSNVSFDGNGRLQFFGSPRYSMEFHNYKAFGNKQFPRQFVDDPEPGTKLVADVQVLEDEAKSTPGDDRYSPLNTNDDFFEPALANSLQMETLTADNPPIVWPAVRSGNLHGHLAMYISADREGNVREAWPLNSDNAGLNDPAREQVRKWKLKPAVDKSGKRVQVDGGLGFVFDTKIDNPLPVITGALIDSQASGCGYKPILPGGLLPSGTTFKIRVSVNEKGKNTGESFPPGIPWDVIRKTGLNTGNCRFKPYLVNGQPIYYFIDFAFTAP
jgi:hypothetical protein